MTDIMKLADDYVDKVARGKSGTQEARAALQSAIEALQGERDAIEKNAINQVDDLHKAWAERDALQAENERLQTGYLKIRVALGLDLHSTDNLLDVAQALKAKLDELQRQEPVGYFEKNSFGLWWNVSPANRDIQGVVPLYVAPKALEQVAWLKQEWFGTGKKSLHFERPEPTVRDEVERPTWRQLYVFDIASEPSGNETP